jgi:hypothetical protein
MNIVGTEGNSVRQIVPAEFNFLSMADRQVVAALEGVLKTVYGLEAGQAIIVSGMRTSAMLVSAGNLGNNGISVAWRYTITEGVVMWNGCLWEFGGGSFDGGPNPNNRVLVMSETVAPPSPVYGENISLDVTPHKRAVCTLMSTEDAASVDQKVALADVRRLLHIDGSGAGTVSVTTIQDIRDVQL